MMVERRHPSSMDLLDAVNYNIDLPATCSVLMRQWHDSSGSGQLLSDWIQGLLHFMSEFVNLSKGHDLGCIRIQEQSILNSFVVKLTSNISVYSNGFVLLSTLVREVSFCCGNSYCRDYLTSVPSVNNSQLRLSCRMKNAEMQTSGCDMVFANVISQSLLLSAKNLYKIQPVKILA